MKTSELIGSALDWAVAKCEGVNPRFNMESHGSTWHGWWIANPIYSRMPHYSTDPSQAYPIIERARISTTDQHGCYGVSQWMASLYLPNDNGQVIEFGPTPLIAAMRCYIASKLGDEIEIPKELL